MLLLELKVMYNHAGVVSGNHLGHSFEQHEATGQIVANKKNVLSTPFNKDEIDIFKSRHKNHIREIEGYDHDIKKYYKIEHTHPTIMLSNLQNYNPTIGITYFEPHATDKLLRPFFYVLLDAVLLIFLLDLNCYILKLSPNLAIAQ